MKVCAFAHGFLDIIAVGRYLSLFIILFYLFFIIFFEGFLSLLGGGDDVSEGLDDAQNTAYKEYRHEDEIQYPDGAAAHGAVGAEEDGAEDKVYSTTTPMERAENSRVWRVKPLKFLVLKVFAHK